MGRPFIAVPEEDEPTAIHSETATPATKPSVIESLSIDALGLALGALGKRTVVAISNLFTLATVASVFWLFYSIRENPTTSQLVLLAMFAVFVLSANWIVSSRGGGGR